MNKRIFFPFLILISILVSWKKESVFVNEEKTKQVFIGIGEITVPESWENKLDTNKDLRKQYEPNQYLIAGKDTLKFGDFPAKLDFILMEEYSAPMILVNNEEQGSYIYRDTIFDAENKKIRKYNDSLIKIDPEIVTHCREYFVAKDSSFDVDYKIPCKTENGIVYADIFVKGYPFNKMISMQSTKVSPARATEIINILKTFRPSK